jgi:hypothetical protein
MTHREELQARIDVLEAALADYIVRYGFTDAGRNAMIGVHPRTHGGGPDPEHKVYGAGGQPQSA